MRLTHSFTLPAPVDRAFGVFGQLNLLAPCFPGASVWGREGEVYHGAVKIKLGPFPLVFEGTARVVRADVSSRQLVVKANARDRRGAAAGAVTVTASFRAVDVDVTAVEVVTELDLTGRPAQLGTGAIASVSDRLKDQFVGCLSGKLTAGLTVDQMGDQAAGDQAAGGSEAGESQVAAPASAARTTPRPEFSYAPRSGAESAPHLQVLPDLARSWLPWLVGAAGGLALLVLVVRRLRAS